jgi:DNA-binding XRE family transcriptional regulator
MRRFTPTGETVTDGGSAYGVLVASQRARLGMSREELAAKIQASTAAVARIEQGYAPGAEMRRKLTATLAPEQPGSLRRLAIGAASAAAAAAGSARGIRFRRPGIAVRGLIGQAERRPQLHIDQRWLWGALAAVLIFLSMAIGGRFSSSDGGPSQQPPVVVSDQLGAPAVLYRARVQSQKEATADARRAAGRAAAAASARRAVAKAGHPKAVGPIQTVTQPVSPSLPSGNGGGGGGSSGKAPQLNHGIGSAGGTVPQTGSGSPDGGNSGPPSDSNCSLPGILC